MDDSIQIDPHSVPAVPSWFGEVVVIAHVLRQKGFLLALQERVHFARARMGTYEVTDFLVVLLGYAISGETTLKAFYERIAPFADAFMALFDRHTMPSAGALSNYLAVFDAPAVEALRLLFQEQLLQPSGPPHKTGGLFDREGTQWIVVDIDGTRKAVRQRSLLQGIDYPAPHRRFLEVAAPLYLGRVRGEIGRTRTTILQIHTHQWLGTFGGTGNGDHREELHRALDVLEWYAKEHSIPKAQIVVRLDGLYGTEAVIEDVLKRGFSILVRCKLYSMLDRPDIRERLQAPPDQSVRHPETGTSRTLFDCAPVLLTPAYPNMRVIIATHPEGTAKAAIGVTREKIVHELFLTSIPQSGFTASDVLDLYLNRGAFETVLADEDREQDPDRWVSRTPCGQECWQILSQLVWNLRFEVGQQISSSSLRLTVFAPTVPDSPPTLDSPPTPDNTPTPDNAPTPDNTPTPDNIPKGRLLWARSPRKGFFAGSDFPLQPDGTLRCPADHPLTPHSKRAEQRGVRYFFVADANDCTHCPLREHCIRQEVAAQAPRWVSAVLISEDSPSAALLPFPFPSLPLVPEEQTNDFPPFSLRPVDTPGILPVIWADWDRCSFRREWMKVIRLETVMILMREKKEEVKSPLLDISLFSRAQRAHWRLSWDQRLERNARLLSDSPFTFILHGLSPLFAHEYDFSLKQAA